MRKLTSS